LLHVSLWNGEGFRWFDRLRHGWLANSLARNSIWHKLGALARGVPARLDGLGLDFQN
jgi:hypothetical protein